MFLAPVPCLCASNVAICLNEKTIESAEVIAVLAQSNYS